VTDEEDVLRIHPEQTPRRSRCGHDLRVEYGVNRAALREAMAQHRMLRQPTALAATLDPRALATG
jgi:hypothetical protein